MKVLVVHWDLKFLKNKDMMIVVLYINEELDKFTKDYAVIDKKMRE